VLTDYDNSSSPRADTGASAPRQSRLRYKGILIALAATASVSLNFVTAKYAMEAIEVFTFVPLWFGTACLYSSVYGLTRRRQWATQLRHGWKPLLGVGLLCTVGSLLLFAGLHQLDPTVTSFLARSDTLFMILLGFAVLGERFTARTSGGIALALVGMTIITYASGRAQIWAATMVIAGYLITSLNRLLIKHIAASTSALLINWARVTTAAVVLTAVAIAIGHFHIPSSGSHLIVLVVGAFFGPFLAQALYFYSLRYIGLSELAVMRTTQPLFVALYASVFLGMVPTAKQFAGGLLIIIGAILLTRGRSVEQVNGRRESEIVTN